MFCDPWWLRGATFGRPAPAVSADLHFRRSADLGAGGFGGSVLAHLAEAFRAGRLRFAGVTAPLAEPSAFSAFLSEQRRKKWVVYAKPPFGSPDQVLEYLARYTHRVAISDSRILQIQDKTVTFGYRDRADGNRRRAMTVDGTEFLRRFALHVLPTGFVRIRYHGLFANRVRADNLKRCRTLLLPAASVSSSSAPAPAARPEESDDNRHRCQLCGTGVLRRLRALDPQPFPELDTWAPVRRDTS